MSIKTILVPMDGSESAFNVLETALVVADRFGAHITTLHVSESAVNSAVYANLSKNLKDAVIAEERTHLNLAAQQISTQMQAYATAQNIVISDSPVKDNGVTISFQHEYGSVSDVLVKTSRLHDTVAMKRPQKMSNVLHRGRIGSTVEAVMMESGKPILIVPPDWPAKKCQHAVIGWNQSVEASRALAMTLPWLNQMERVTIVASKDRLGSGEKVKQQLAWHHIDANVEVLNRQGDSAGQRLLKVCEQIDGDFLVLGGFSQSRLKQRIFGGVTNHILNNTNVITVMVH